jgi:hypothetical protein
MAMLERQSHRLPKFPGPTYTATPRTLRQDMPMCSHHLRLIGLTLRQRGLALAIYPTFHHQCRRSLSHLHILRLLRMPTPTTLLTQESRWRIGA